MGASRKIITHTLPSGKTIAIAEFSYGDWENCREQALVEYRDGFIRTWARNIDLLGLTGDARERKLMEKIDEAGKTSDADIPQQETEIFVKGQRVKQKVPYSLAWINTQSGQIHAIWLAMRAAGSTMSKDEVVQLMIEEGATDEVASRLASLNASDFVGDTNPTGADQASQAKA